MKKEQITKNVARGVVATLNTLLRADANSASCVIAYQPKVPKQLARFRKDK